jgi:RNA 2',3'-cyclic 3'-phosphodiesterase
MNFRGFLAITIPDGPAARLRAIQRGVYGAKWRPRENFHLTVRFLDQVRHDQARALDELLAEYRQKPFELTIRGVGWFGGAEPRALWVGIAPSEPLMRLVTGVDRMSSKAGFDPRSEKFTPHITLAYCAGTTAQDAARFAQRLALFHAGAFVVDGYGLYSSWQTKRLNRYVEEAFYPLT